VLATHTRILRLGGAAGPDYKFNFDVDRKEKMEPESTSSIAQVPSAVSNDTRRSWSIESAIQWGVRSGLDGQRLAELQEFATLIKTVELSASDLTGGTTLDSGSFGVIEKSTFNGVTVAVKRFIKVFHDFSVAMTER
jgi:hypothetical protein